MKSVSSTIAQFWFGELGSQSSVAAPSLMVAFDEMLVPVTVTNVPPLVGPWPGETLVIVGAAPAVYVNWFTVPVAVLFLPSGLVMVMVTTPAAWLGITAFHNAPPVPLKYEPEIGVGAASPA